MKITEGKGRMTIKCNTTGCEARINSERKLCNACYGGDKKEFVQVGRVRSPSVDSNGRYVSRKDSAHIAGMAELRDLLK